MACDSGDSGRCGADGTERSSRLSGAHLHVTAEEITALAGAIEDYISTCPPFAGLNPVALNHMAYGLTDELMLLAATQSAQAVHARAHGKRGVRPKVGEAALIGRLQALATQNGVDHLQQWRNGRGGREDLTTMCSELMRIAGTPGTVSQRTAVLAKQQIRTP